MSADPELHQLAIDIVNAGDECETGGDRIASTQTMIWNFFYGHPNGRLKVMTAERDEARDWVRRMHAETQTLTCVYCGQAYPPGTPASGSEALTAHVSVCPKHPMAVLRAEVGRVEDKLRAGMNWHHGMLSGYGWGADLAKILRSVADRLSDLTRPPAAPGVPRG